MFVLRVMGRMIVYMDVVNDVIVILKGSVMFVLLWSGYLLIKFKRSKNRLKLIDCNGWRL